MEIARLKIENFRGIKESELFFNAHTVLVGDNNVGKSTVLEAIDLTLGPDRLSKYPVIDEHDFYAGEYLIADKSVEINIETVIINLSEEQIRHFYSNIEWWNLERKSFVNEADKTGDKKVIAALRVAFKGYYDKEEDDFIGKTYFCNPVEATEEQSRFGKNDKRLCGFLYLRTLRTGSRALSLERGSLLDIILKLMELRPQMWEDILTQLRDLSVAEKPELGISEVLENIQSAIREIVPVEWAENPKLRVSNLTREHLRHLLTIFIGTGATTSDGSKYSAPFQHQGTGTINALVLVLLSMIADLKQNVIFAMEEPEIAIPPYTQKRIINSIREKSAQAIFTSHSPYVLEEFDPTQVLVLNRDKDGKLKGISATYPPTIKPKSYKDAFRRRFCEGLLSRRVLITEGRTEYDSFPACAKRLNEISPDKFKTLDALGITIIDAGTETQVAAIGGFYKRLGKEVFAVFDKQSDESLLEIIENVHYPFEAQEKGFEKVLLNGISIDVLKKYAIALEDNGEWPAHITPKPSMCSSDEEYKDTTFQLLKNNKGSGIAAELLSSCNTKEEMPEYIVKTIESITGLIELV
ncbi:MAG: AAA family ATPase [Bacteroidales bacterium]|jgi:putative ATP-dependent endonuclease of OLD family|nr:AAA family ATPase [Bacteroidales bacterium]